MLLAEHCITDRDCHNCSFKEGCVVHNFYYHPLKIVPPSVKNGGSLGYTIECFDRRTKVRSGDQMRFHLLLYGDVIAYFSVLLDGLYRLGMNGIGKGHQGRFEILRIEDQDQNRLFYSGNVSPSSIHVRDLMEDARRLSERSPNDLKIEFVSVWSQTWKNQMLDHFELEAFADSIYRRIYLMHCLEGIEIPDKRAFDLSATSATVLKLNNKAETRYSNTQRNHIHLKGIQTAVKLMNLPDDILLYLYAAEIVHIGKNTSIGFGKFVIGRN